MIGVHRIQVAIARKNPKAKVAVDEEDVLQVVIGTAKIAPVTSRQAVFLRLADQIVALALIEIPLESEVSDVIGIVKRAKTTTQLTIANARAREFRLGKTRLAQ